MLRDDFALIPAQVVGWASSATGKVVIWPMSALKMSLAVSKHTRAVNHPVGNNTPCILESCSSSLTDTAACCIWNKQERTVVLCESLVTPRPLREAVAFIFFQYLQVKTRSSRPVYGANYFWLGLSNWHADVTCTLAYLSR